MKNPRGYLVAALCSGLAFVLQGIGTVRYVSRLPDDGVGIGLYLITTVLFAVAAVGFYSKWIAERQGDECSPSRSIEREPLSVSAAWVEAQPDAVGIADRADELLHLAMDGLERERA